jgi:hypothetical protein
MAFNAGGVGVGSCEGRLIAKKTNLTDRPCCSGGAKRADRDYHLAYAEVRFWRDSDPLLRPLTCCNRGAYRTLSAPDAPIYEYTA